MKKFLFLFFIVLLLGCVNKKPNVGLEVSFVTRGCSGIESSSSEVTILPEGLSVISNIISDGPCYKLSKAEISRKDLNLTVYFTFAKESDDCLDCIGINSLVYKITGAGLNSTGVNVTVISYFNGGAEVKHSFSS